MDTLKISYHDVLYEVWVHRGQMEVIDSRTGRVVKRPPRGIVISKAKKILDERLIAEVERKLNYG